MKFLFTAGSALSFAACSWPATTCTLAAGIPLVSVETSTLAVSEPETVVVCLDERCVPLGTSELGRGQFDEMATAIKVEGDNSERTLLVRTLDGEVLAGPAAVEIPTVYPNGKDCPGATLQGSFRLTPEAEIEAVTDADQ